MLQLMQFKEPSNIHDLRGVWRENHVLKPYTSWRVGGAARYFYQPADLEDLQKFLQELPKELPIFWLGAGTNVLIRDSGVDGLVICINKCLDKLQPATNVSSGAIMAEAGVSCARLVQLGINLGMLDMSFLAGIPGTIGGALAMNAGAYGNNIWQHVLSVTLIKRSGELIKRQASEFNVGYRQVSGLAKDEWFVSSCLQFTASDVQLTKDRVHELLLKRRTSQPLDTFNCGSVFRNPPGDYAARLIESCSLKGKCFGGAKVSEKHANFIINDGTATSQDIELLIEYVEDSVYKQCGIKLEKEVRVFGI